jgi:hypothetical protein
MADATITFGASQVFGDLSGWSEQNTSLNKTSQRASVLGLTGNEVAGKLYDEKTEASASYQANVDGSAPSLPANIGALLNSAYILTGISVSTNWNAHVSMDLTGHNHTDNAHAASPALNSVAHSITLTDGFGSTDFLGGTAGDNASVESSTIEITCQHEDKNQGDGKHLVGENYNPMITTTVTWTGEPTSSNDGTWDQVEEITNSTNVAHNQHVYRGIKALAFS